MDSNQITSKDPGLFALDALIRTLATRKVNTIAIKCSPYEVRYEFIGLDLHTYEGFVNERYIAYLPRLLTTLIQSGTALFRYVENRYYSIRISGNNANTLFYLDLTSLPSAP